MCLCGGYFHSFCHGVNNPFISLLLKWTQQIFFSFYVIGRTTAVFFRYNFEIFVRGYQIQNGFQHAGHGTGGMEQAEVCVDVEVFFPGQLGQGIQPPGRAAGKNGQGRPDRRRRPLSLGRPSSDEGANRW